jgi:hypothetical protein
MAKGKQKEMREGEVDQNVDTFSQQLQLVHLSELG